MRDDALPTPELLLHAYMSGVFPMSEHRDDPEMFWVDPKRRGVFPLDGFHISRSLARSLKKNDYHVDINRDFYGVVEGCADRGETWISSQIAELYQALHEMGHAHSIEVYRDTRLIGGVYGVTLGTAFFGESMFSREKDASKIALAWLVDHLRRTGFTLFDTQFLTPHLATLGAIEISRADYRAQLSEATGKTADITALPLAQNGHEVVQRNTQTS